MLTLDSGSVSLSRSARSDSVQMIWRVAWHSDFFPLDTTVLRCVKVAQLSMFLQAHLFDTDLLIFEENVMISVYWYLFYGQLEILLGMSSRENLKNVTFFFYHLHRRGQCSESASIGLRWIFCFCHLIDWCCFYYLVRNSLVALLETVCAVSVSKVRMYAFIISSEWMHSYAAVFFQG